jgi:DHA1 family bicyclomycin/chloramphenicol resistance-like MFS transporter
LLFCAAIGAQFAFPVLTLRMLDLFPAARGTAASAQSFVALLVTAFTLGIISPRVLPHLEWIAWTSLALTGTAAVCWFFSLRALRATRPVDAL